jgi:putative heme-binding domain-containing protein
MLVLSWPCIGPQAATASIPAIPIKVAPGFAVEVCYSVPPNQGSWVSMAVDGKGRLITSDQFGKLYRVTFDTDAARSPQVSPLDVNLGGAQGLLWAFESLYMVANRDKDHGGSGLYRLRDIDGDDRFDEVRLLRTIAGNGEHGPHALVPGPDGRSLYLVAGNATFLPDPERSLVPPNWGMNRLLAHLGQSDGVWRTDRPGGWICRLDPGGRSWEVVAVGLRNPYDIAFNADGELFTFDADMEWDLGTPWYRPTRVNHVISGAEFGWRTGSAKWPDYYGDSVGAVQDVGESSPTGLVFGYGARFPARYQRALFMGDWSYGKIYALTLEPDGATYRAVLESFLAGSPLPVTDLVIRPQDGALYFLTGGRNTASTLYRVIYRGPEPTGPVDLHDSKDAQARELHHSLARFHHGPDPTAVESVWPYLGHTDRTLRYTARVALEHQPVAQWQSRALGEDWPRAKLTALMALARCGTNTVRPRLLEALQKLEWNQLGQEERLDLVRVCSLACLRMGPLTADERAAVLTQMNGLFPAGLYELDRELCELLVYLHAPGIVSRALTAMESAPSQEEQMHDALCLRTLDPNQWTAADRERYFRWFGKALTGGGGVTYSDYLIAIRNEAAEKLNATIRAPLEPLLNLQPPADPYLDLKQRQFVKEWTVQDLLPAVESATQAHNLEQGRRIFSTAMCIKCHRLNRQGGMGGPDLTGVGNRFDNRALLESILEPSKVVSDQYATVTVHTKDGESNTGRIGDQNDVEILLKSDLLNPASLKRIKRAEIDIIVPSTLSLMPSNLLDAFTQDDILQLLAYLKAQGKDMQTRNPPAFRH